MKRNFLVLVAILLSLAVLPLGASAQDDPYEVAYVKEGNVWLGTVGQDDHRQITSDAAIASFQDPYATYSPRYTNLTWSPDGLYLAFTGETSGGASLFVYRIPPEPGQPVPAGYVDAPVVRATGLDTRFPVAWSPLSDRIAYAVALGGTGDEGTYEIRAAAADGSQMAIALGQVVIDVSADGSEFADPAARLHDSLIKPALIWADAQSLLYTPGFDGFGLRKLNLADGTSSEIDPNIERVKLSPSGRFLLGIKSTDSEASVLGIFDLLNDSWREQVTIYDPVHVSWMDDSEYSVAYTARELRNTITLPETDKARAEKVIGVWPVVIEKYQSRLQVVSLLNDDDALAYQVPAHAITEPFYMDGWIYFTQISNTDVWLSLFQEGKDAANMLYNVPWPFVLRIDPRTLQNDVILENVAEYALRPQPEAVG